MIYFMIKIMSISGPILIIALLSLITAEPYYRKKFYYFLLTQKFLTFLAVWIGASLIFKTSFDYPYPKGIYWRAAVVWSLASVLCWLIDHIVLSRLKKETGDRFRYPVPMFLLTWVLGILLVLGWLFDLALLVKIFTSNHLGWLKVLIEVMISIIVLTSVIIIGINLAIRLRFREKIRPMDAIQKKGTAVVFGAGVYQDTGKPSQVLMDRIRTAVLLVERGKVDRVILSGDGSEGSAEVDVMARYSVHLCIPEELLVLDTAGYRTYETCARAATEFGVQDALLVTQNFHLPRALLICDSFGLEAVGVRADQTRYSLLSHLVWALRESLATAYAWLEVTFRD